MLMAVQVAVDWFTKFSSLKDITYCILGVGGGEPHE